LLPGKKGHENGLEMMRLWLSRRQSVEDHLMIQLLLWVPNVSNGPSITTLEREREREREGERLCPVDLRPLVTKLKVSASWF